MQACKVRLVHYIHTYIHNIVLRRMSCIRQVRGNGTGVAPRRGVAWVGEWDGYTDVPKGYLFILDIPSAC